jgi:signal transduction histidine kinase
MQNTRAVSRRYLLWLAAGTSVLALAMAVLLVFEWMQKLDILQNKGLQKDSIVSLVFQFDREFSTFRQTLDAATASNKSPDFDDISLRFDLLQSRMLLLEDNPSLAMFSRRDEYLSTFPKVKALIKRTETVLQKQPLKKEDLAVLLGSYTRLQVDVRTLSMAANSQVQKLMEQQFDTMLVQSELIVGLTVAQLVFLLLAAAGLAWRHMRQTEEQEQIELELENRVLERTNDLQNSNRALENAMSDLRAAQSQLVLAEKMATLGQLVTNIAHEINTPIGAVKSSGQTIADSVQYLIAQLPEVLQSMDAAMQQLFVRLLGHLHQSDQEISLREERAITRSVMRELEQAGVEGAAYKARVLVQLRAHCNVQQFLPLVQHSQSHAILDAANGIATVAHSADNINSAVERVSKVVFALKSYSRSEQVGVRMDVQLKEGIETILTIYQNHFKNDLTLVRQYEEQPMVYCYPDEMNQVWTNLILNAMQAMKYQGTLTIALRTHEQYAVVTVSDTGSGIPEEIRDKIFDAFFTTKTSGEGSGLGLDIARRVVEKHNGRIEFWTEVGVGTSFTVYLPLDARRIPAPSQI